ncbi:MAG: WXG100 family type VII secretion target [Erysipelotrichaceae bacterium]|nr:WXG100 family type VII secretion target [Erysipelotrichaceae bacterium]
MVGVRKKLVVETSELRKVQNTVNDQCKQLDSAIGEIRNNVQADLFNYWSGEASDMFSEKLTQTLTIAEEYTKKLKELNDLLGTSINEYNANEEEILALIKGI